MSNDPIQIIPMWRWEVDKEEFEQYPVTFVLIAITV